jgi:hypothetical protein
MGSNVSTLYMDKILVGNADLYDSSALLVSRCQKTEYFGLKEDL